jgi:hypothetical protein
MTIMAKPPKGLATMAAGVSLGLALLYISSLIISTEPGGVTGWGFPFFWLMNAAASPGPTVFRVNIALNLVFWLGLSLTAVEMLSRFAVPYIRRG